MRYLLLVIVFLIAACTTTEQGEKDQEEVQEEIQFADPNLKAVIRKAIAKPKGSILKPDLEGLRELGSECEKITDLSGLEHCINLQVLYLGFHQISDISPLSGLTNLKQLDLAGNQINDINPLGRLTNLQVLDLAGNQINDLSPLSHLTSLKWLDLTGNQVSDISSLVENSGISRGDKINLKLNPLDDEAYEVHIPTLQQRGVIVLFDPKP